MNTVEKKIDNILEIIMDLKNDNLLVHSALLEGFSLSIELLSEIEKNKTREVIDVSRHIEIITNILGISLEEIAKQCLNEIGVNNQESTKDPDEETLNFITSDLDDYEKFLAKNSSKESLEFLTKEL